MTSSSIYGLTVQSNRPIPQTRSVPAAVCIDLQIVLGELPDWLGAMWSTAEHRYSGANVDDQSQPALVISRLERGAWFHLRYSDGTEFLVDRIGSRLWASWRDPLTIEDTATYLLGPVMGFLLLLRGTHALHASAINVDGHAIALVGAAGYGKSTTAAVFAKLGYSVIAEDVVTLARERGQFIVHPAYPCIRLWPESVNALFGAPDALPLLTPNWDKRYLELGGNEFQFQPDALPLAAIYLLGDRSDDASAPRIEDVAPAPGLIELVANSYVPFFKDKDARAAEFKVLSDVMSKIPVRRAIPNADLGQVDRLCEAILDDFRMLPQSGTATDLAELIECI